MRPSPLVQSSPFEAHAPEFAAVLGPAPRLQLVVEADAHEGPVYAADEDALYFTTLPSQVPATGFPRVAVRRLALDGDRFPLGPERLSTVAETTRVANGMALGPDGRLVVCEQGTRSEPARIGRLDRSTGAMETVVDHWRGLRLNSPNGLASSPDELVLYVTDSGANQEAGSYHVGRPHHVVAFEVRNGRHLAGGRLFAVTTPGFPDGVKVDAEGRVYVSASSGVQVFDPDGDLIGELHLPGTVNFCFGGPGGNLLFITTDTAVWAAVLHARGA